MTIPYPDWGAIDQEAMREMALDPATKLIVYRLMFASVGWANLSGHAEMSPGELARRMTVLTKAGDFVVPSSQSLSNAIKDARSQGLIAPGSSARCLIAPVWFTKTGGRGGRACKFHGLRGRQ